MAEKHEVVISGIGGMFPGSANLETLGKNILANEYLVTREESVWNQNQMTDVEPVAGRLPDWDQSDNPFFGMHNKLSIWTDPTTKLGFERCFEAMIDAGVHPASLRGSNTQVFVGMHLSDNEAGSLAYMDKSDGYGIMGHSRAMSSNRVSYFFGFTGHSCTYSAAEAFGPLGVRMAAEAISSGQCEAALVVTSTTICVPSISQMYKDMGYLSQDLLCHPFEETATGMHRSECCIAFLLQRADLAKRCYATVVAADAVHLGSRLRFDFTLPSPAGLQAFLNNMYTEHDVDPRSVAYVEADGIGHHLSDVTELNALDGAIGRSRPAGQPLLVGSVKSNAGHTEVCSGMFGMVKAIVAMESGVIPATINHVQDVADAKCLAEGRLKVVTKNTPLEVRPDTHVAVNTMSLSGLCGHTILRPNPKAKTLVADASKELPRLVVLSGRSEEALTKMAEKVRASPYDPEYIRLLQDTFGPSIRGYEYRSYVIFPADPTQAIKVSHVDKRTVWFVFSGMGSQWAGMGSSLMQLPVFAETIERLHAVLAPKGVDLKHIITETGPTAFDNILKSFVGITACQIALTNVLFAVGLRPDGIIGHSVGELGCAYADGCLTEAQTILAAWARGKASNEAKLIKGMMAAVGLGYKAILPRLPPTVEVACHNSSTSCTLSGPAEDVKNFVAKLSSEGVFARNVNVCDIAYHSQCIQPAAPFLRRYLEEVIPEPKKRSSKWISTSVPQHLMDTPAAQYCSAEYQTNNLLSSVLFEEGLAYVPEQAVLVEIAPHGLLQAILKRALPNNVNIPLTQRDHAAPLHFLLEALGRLTFHGAELDVAKLYPEVNFPVSRGTPSISPLATWELGARYYGAFFLSCRSGEATTQLYNDSPHMRVGGAKLLPYSEALDSAWTARGILDNDQDVAVSLRNIVVHNKLQLPHDEAMELSTKVSPAQGSFEVEETYAERLVISGTATSLQAEDAPPALPDESFPADALTLSGQDILADLAAKGLSYSPKYNALKSVLVGNRDWIIRLDSSCPRAAILEALLQVLQYRASEEAMGLVLLKRLLRLDVDPVKMRERDEVVVRYSLSSGAMSGHGIYAMGFEGMKEDNPDEGSFTSPLNFQFVRYGNSNLQSVGEFVSLAVQLALEGLPTTKKDCSITILELQNCSGPNVLGPAVRSLLQEKMGIKVNVKTLSVGSGRSLSLPEVEQGMCLTVSAPNTLTEGVRVAAHVGGLLLTRSSERVSTLHSQMGLVAEQRTGADGEWVSLLRRPVAVVPERARVLQMARGQAPPARVLEAGPDHPVVLVWRGQPDGGVPQVVDQVRRRPYAAYARLVFILDESAPAFSLTDPLYAGQLKLQLQVNVLHRKTWGCWLGLPLVGAAPAAFSASSLEGTTIEAYGFNPKERSPTSAQQVWCGHLDYVGVSPKGQRVMGIARWVSETSRPRLDSMLQWAVPQGWSSADAATVPYVYANVYHALTVVAGLKRGQSIMVHEGASAVGQAAIRVALQLGCSIFTTVGDESQRRALRLLFPQIEDRRVMSCADGATSFEWRIRTLTNSAGVDVVFSALPGDQMKASMRCLQHFGKMVHYGREDMLASTTIGLFIFLQSLSFTGLTGDQLFLANEEDRRLVHAAVQEGLDSGHVQPIEGTRVFNATNLASIKEALLSVRGEYPAPSKVVISVHKNKRQDECSGKRSYVIVGGQQHEWLQVAGWVAQHGAHEVLVVADSASASPSLVRHRQRALRRLFDTNVRVQLEDNLAKSLDEGKALRALKTAANAAPVDAVIALVKDDASVVTVLHAAMKKDGLSDASLVVLAESALTACGLSELCESRRASGLRAACIAGPLNSAAAHLVDLLGGCRPAVTLLKAAGPAADDALHEVPDGVPRDAQALLELGRVPRTAASCHVRDMPTLGLRLRHSREALPVFAVPPLGVLDQQGQSALAALALRIINPMMLVQAAPADTLGQQAAAVVQAIVRTHPVGPYTVLGWGLGTPLVLEVSRQLEAQGHKAVTMLVLGDVLQVQAWAQEQADASLLRTIFSDEQSQEILENAADPLRELLATLPESQRGRAEAGFLTLRTAVNALARHTSNLADPFRGRLIDVQADRASSFTRANNVLSRIAPRQEVPLGLRSTWLATLIMEYSGVSKEATLSEVRPLLAALA
ncbi:fatty acid synthase-like [Thrips palmi]|uniref:Fatty acid synthase-like n=1 Tax=Thrips palmi TaxID=161013 RepID=A0A6P8ZPU8_THRPL|nr:fatty acid synthase-like [Thrips palmi]